jgi:hypothetical protein
LQRKKTRSISISSLARFAADPNSIFDKVNAGAANYGNRAHAAVGKGPSIVAYILIAVSLLAAAKYMGLF